MNKYEKAFKNLQIDRDGIAYFHDINLITATDDIDNIKELIERATPKRPIEYYEPALTMQCECKTWTYQNSRFCPYCGQAFEAK